MRPIPEALRWLGATLSLVAVALVSVVLLGDALGDLFAAAPPEQATGAGRTGEVAQPSEPAPTAGGPVQDGSATPLADLAVAGGAVTQAASPRLTIGGDAGGDSLHLAFATIPGNPGCLASVSLEMTVLEATPTELGAYPSALRDLDRLGADAEVPQPAVAEGRPRALAFTDGTPGRLRWSLTDLYAAWVRGELAAAGTPLVVAIAPTEADPSAAVALAAAEAGGAAAPRLVWTGTPGCGR
ncbi:MAG: hypothetical protein M3N52_11285 [Actinomycetota bacterium]|nr:hypothetical protein [Actinomycetota bacterium]